MIGLHQKARSDRWMAGSAMALALGCLTGAAAAADWPMAGYDAANTRFAADETKIGVDNVARLQPRQTWTTGGSNWATPVVSEDGIFFPDSGGMISGIDLKTGEFAWQRSLSDYTGIEKANARSSAAVANGLVMIGDRNGANLMAIDAETGELAWMTDIEEHPGAQITGSPIVAGDRVYFGISSNEGSKFVADRAYSSNFRGSLVAVDIADGAIAWRAETVPDNGGALDSWSGGAVIASAAIDEERGRIYYHGDHYYSQPAEVVACLEAAADDWDASCYPEDAHANALVAADLATGEPVWTFLGSGVEAYEIACGELPSVTWQLPVEHNRMCPPVGDWVNWGFAVGAPNLFSAEIDGVNRDLVGVAQKSGFYWAFDADSGEVVWTTWVGPFSEPGGLAQGAAYDGERLYVTVANFENTPHFVGQTTCEGGICEGGLRDGQTPIWGGSWAALDPATGAILWQTGEPNNQRAYSSPVVANGVVYVGSLAPQGPQMFALSADSGEILWQFEAGGSVAASPAIVDGAIYWGAGFALFGGTPTDQFYVFTVDGL